MAASPKTVATVRDEATGELVAVPLVPGSGGGGTLAGDVTGPAGSNTVEKLRGRDLSAVAPAVGQAITSPDGTTWTPMYAQGLKKRIRSGQTVVVGQDFQYMTKGTVTIDPGGTLTIDPEGEQVVLP